MPLNYLLTYRKTHSCSFILAAPAMEPLEWGENLIDVLLLETDSIIFDHDLKFAIGFCAPYFDYRLLAIFTELQGIADEILEHLPHLRGVGFDNREF
jgi:hypothetical protein